MTRQLDFTGKSGTIYRYKALEEMLPAPPGGANFLYVTWVKNAPVIVYAGETDSLHRSVYEAWPEAQSDHGATEIFARLNITGVVRRAEQADLVDKHKPAMNAAVESDPRKAAAAKA